VDPIQDLIVANFVRACNICPSFHPNTTQIDRALDHLQATHTDSNHLKSSKKRKKRKRKKGSVINRCQQQRRRRQQQLLYMYVCMWYTHMYTHTYIHVVDGHCVLRTSFCYFMCPHPTVHH
jgi:hypothetical protein